MTSILFAVFTHMTDNNKKEFNYHGLQYGDLEIRKHTALRTNLLYIGCVDTPGKLNKELVAGSHVISSDSLDSIMNDVAKKIFAYRDRSGAIDVHVKTISGTHLNIYVKFIKTSHPNIYNLIDSRMKDYAVVMDQFIYPNLAVDANGNTMPDAGFELFG